MGFKMLYSENGLGLRLMCKDYTFVALEMDTNTMGQGWALQVARQIDGPSRYGCRLSSLGSLWDPFKKIELFCIVTHKCGINK